MRWRGLEMSEEKVLTTAIAAQFLVDEDAVHLSELTAIEIDRF